MTWLCNCLLSSQNVGITLGVVDLLKFLLDPIQIPTGIMFTSRFGAILAKCTLKQYLLPALLTDINEETRLELIDLLRHMLQSKPC